MSRANKVPLAHKDLPVQEARRARPARKVRSDLKERKAKQGARDPQVPRASEEKRERRDQPALQDPPVLSVLLEPWDLRVSRLGDSIN